MRIRICLPLLSALLLATSMQTAIAQLQPEQPSSATLPPPTDSWLLAKTREGSYLFDGATGEMQGMFSHNWFTPAIVTLPSRGEAYFVESFLSRGVLGERNDVVSVVGLSDLRPIAEIDIPDKAAALSFRHHVGLLGDLRHLVVYNLTPAQSVSVVDVVDRKFVDEISTPGCAIMMPVGERSFLMLCGDGTLQLIELDRKGREVARERSAVFFSVEDDAVFDRPVETDAGWLLVTYHGQVYEARVQGREISITGPWSLLVDEDLEDEWRPGGQQPFSLHRGTGLLYVLMHQGGEDTHHNPGTEVWVFDVERQRRAGRLVLESEAGRVLSSQETEPRLYVGFTDDSVGVFDGLLLRQQRTIRDIGPDGPWLLETVAHRD